MGGRYEPRRPEGKLDKKPQKVKGFRYVCPHCKRDVGVRAGRFYTHGPGQDGEVFCKGSGRLL